MPSPLSICTFLLLDSLAQAVTEALSDDDRFNVIQQASQDRFCQFVEQEKHHLDCLILQDFPALSQITTWLQARATLLPAVIVMEPAYFRASTETISTTFRYHTAEIKVSASDLSDIGSEIEQAIAQFVHLSPTAWVKSGTSPLHQDESSPIALLLPQQQRLAEKLNERLGYLGLYYKRDPHNFFRRLSPTQQQELLEVLKATYREIVLRYFSHDNSLNQRIDDFVNTAFLTDISAAQIVEIHMELIDEFSKQLKLEGRSEEVLLDYRLTLIDTIAHLCEMYRRSVPREM